MGFAAELSNIAGQILLRRKRGVGSIVAGFALAGLWQVYKRCGGPAFTATTYRDTRILIDPQSVTSSRFVYEGRPDEQFIEILAAFGGAGTAFVDVGANVGMYTVLLCREFARGWLFEPNPVAVRAIKTNLALNDAGERFVILPMAVGEAVGTARFPCLDTADPAACVRLDAGDVPTIEIPVTTLDRALPPDGDYVVKIDAEGFDAAVIRGMSNLLAKGRIHLCLFECHTDAILREVLDCVTPHDALVMDGARQVIAPAVDRGRDLFVVPRRSLPTYLDALQRAGAKA